MAGNIKGLFVEIGADTSKLEAAFRSADNSIKSTQSQLRDLNRELKLNPGNTDLLRDKQKALASEISNTKDKLSALEQAQKEMDEKVNNAFKKANYLIHENTKVPIQIEPDDGRELPVKMDRDMGEMLYGTEVRNGRMVKKVFHAKVVGGVLDLTKIREKDLKIIREKGIHPRRFGHNRDSGRTR